jgi:DNA-binding winged helix-turn-helix (wHTH) protein
MSTLTVGSWLVDKDARTLTNRTQEHRLSPRALRLLTTLADHQGEAMSREYLLSKIWPDVTVGDESLTQAIAELRRAFGDERHEPRYIETISKHGYRLVAHVSCDQGRIMGSERSSNATLDIEAYSLILEARRTFSYSGKGSMEIVEALAREAVSRAPRYGLPSAELSKVLVYKHLYHHGSESDILEAVEFAEDSIRLSPLSASGFAALGFSLSAAGEVIKSKQAFERALSLDNSNIDSLYLAARANFSQGNMLISTVLAERAAEVGDGFRAHFAAANSASTFATERSITNAQQALRLLKEGLSINPNNHRAQIAYAGTLAGLGNAEDAAAYLSAIDYSGSPLEYYAFIVFALAGYPDTALDVLESAIEHGWRHSDWLRNDPITCRFKSNKRFKRLSQMAASEKCVLQAS